MSERRKIVVFGGGCAGLLSALAIRKHCPEDELVVVRSTKMGVIGVGEGTIYSVVNFLHNFLEIDRARFYREVLPTLKLGIRYHWGPREKFHYTFTPQFSTPVPGTQLPRGYFCMESCDFIDEASVMMHYDKVCGTSSAGEPRLPHGYAYHLENERFVAFLELLADEQGIERIDAIVDDAHQSGGLLESLQLDNGMTVSGDLFLDCSGFRSVLLSEMSESEFVPFNDALFCDAAIVGGWTRGEDEPILPYTTVDTMKSGWSWKIEHDQTVNRGYVYSSQFLTAEEAEEEFRTANPKLEMTRPIRFRSGAYRRPWIGNVIAMGNAAGFVEPLEATAIGLICDSVVRLCRTLRMFGKQAGDAIRESYNRVQFKNWEIVRDFLALHYKFNTRFDTPFWNHCREQTPLGQVQEWVDFYQEVGPDMRTIEVEFKRDFFDVEGYLAILVGQNVPYKRRVEMTPRDKNAWRSLRSRLEDQALSGIDMATFLQQVRDGAPTMQITSNREQSGELQWH